jgi:hypothetical protein
MALNDYESDNRCAFELQTTSCFYEDKSRFNQILSIIGTVFVMIFTLEAMLKIFALGFICGENTYLKNNWNRLDFIIVVAGIIEFALEMV